MSASMQQIEMKAQMQMQFGMIKNCFTDCVVSFREDRLTAKEQTCLQGCAKREIGSFQSMAGIQSQIMQRQGMGGGPQF